MRGKRSPGKHEGDRTVPEMQDIFGNKFGLSAKEQDLDCFWIDFGLFFRNHDSFHRECAQNDDAKIFEFHTYHAIKTEAGERVEAEMPFTSLPASLP